MSIATQEQLLTLARKLPAERVREVVDFAEFLLVRSRPRGVERERRGRGALRRYIGGVEHGRLAQGIDEELYGRAVR